MQKMTLEMPLIIEMSTTWIGGPEIQYSVSGVLWRQYFIETWSKMHLSTDGHLQCVRTKLLTMQHIFTLNVEHQSFLGIGWTHNFMIEENEFRSSDFQATNNDSCIILIRDRSDIT